MSTTGNNLPFSHFFPTKSIIYISSRIHHGALSRSLIFSFPLARLNYLFRHIFWKIRYHALMCIHVMSRLGPPKLFYQYYPMLVPSSPHPLNYSLFTNIFNDPTAKVIFSLSFSCCSFSLILLFFFILLTYC